MSTVRHSAASSTTKLLSTVGVAADVTSGLFNSVGKAVAVAEVKATNWHKAVLFHSAKDLQVKIADNIQALNDRLEDPKFKAAFEQAGELLKAMENQ